MKPRREQVLDIAREEIGGEVPSLRNMDSNTADRIADAEKQVYGRQAPIEQAGMHGCTGPGRPLLLTTRAGPRAPLAWPQVSA